MSASTEIGPTAETRPGGAGSPSSPAPPSGRWRRTLADGIENYGIAVVLIPMVVFFAASNPNFMTTSNWLNVLQQMAVYGIVGVGMTYLMLMAQIDLSVGSIIAFAGVLSAKAASGGGSVALALVVAVGAGIGVGLVNGGLTVVFRLPSLLVTLGTLSIIRGLGYVVTDARPVVPKGDSFSALGNGHLLGVPDDVWIMAVVVLIGTVILSQTRYGRHVYGIGGNQEAARRAGIHISRTIVIGFAITGALAGLAGGIEASRLASGQPVVGQGYELTIIAATVLGGTSLFGGRGTVPGTLLGALVLALLHNGLDLLSVTPYWQTVATGIVIVLALILDAAREQRVTLLRHWLLGARDR